MLKESKIRSSEGINNSQFFLLHHHRITASWSCVVHWPRWSELTLSLVESNLVAVLLPRLPAMTLKFFRIYCLPHRATSDFTKTMMIFELSENSLARLNRNYPQDHDVLTTTTNGEDAAERKRWEGKNGVNSPAINVPRHFIGIFAWNEEESFALLP